MNDTSLTFTKTISIEALVNNAVESSNPTKFKTLLVIGLKEREIRKIAKEKLGASTQALKNLTRAIEWQKFHTRIKLPDLLLKEIYDLENSSDAEENLRFFLASGGSIDHIMSCLKSIKMPTQQDKKVIFLDLIRRTIAIEQQFLEESPSLEPKKKMGLFGKPFLKEQMESCDHHLQKEAVAATMALFTNLIKQNEPARLLHEATKGDLKDLVARMIDLQVDINSPYPGTGATPLHTAAHFGKEELVEWLLNHGARVNAVSNITVDAGNGIKKGAETPLHMACIKGQQRVVAILLSHEADLEVPTALGFTPLHYACDRDPVIAGMLIRKGANINATNDKGESPFHYACKRGFLELIEHMLIAGADPSIIDMYLEPPIQAGPEETKSKLIAALFSNHKQMQELLKGRTASGILQCIKLHPEKLLVPRKELASSNPLEVPFIFGDAQLASSLKSLMDPYDFNLALGELKKKYPKQRFRLLIAANLQVNRPIVYQQTGKDEIPPVSEIERDKLHTLFGNIAFFYSNALRDVAQNSVFIDENTIMKREVIDVTKDGGEPDRKVVLTKVIDAAELKKAPLEECGITDTGSIKIGDHEYPYVIMKIGDVMMPVKLFHKQSRKVVELRVELLTALLSSINFTDPKAPGFRNPDTIVDSGSAKNAPPTKVTLKELRRGLKDLCEAINFRIAYVGTPKSNETEKLEEWYQYFEKLVKHITIHSVNEDLQAKEQLGTSKLSDPTPSAPAVIELAISGLHCGTRSLDDAQFLYDTKFAKLETIKDKVLRTIEHLKTGIGEAMVDLSNAHNVHVKNKIFQVIDEYAGIPDAEKKKRYYFNDTIAPQHIDQTEIIRIFTRDFSPAAILDAVDKAINGRNPELNKDLVIDWFKDNVPESWERKKYQEIRKGLEQLTGKEDKAAFLQDYNISMNPIDLKKAEEPNWDLIINEDRQTSYLEREVMDMESGKILLTALVFMLKKFGVFSN